jgi:putative membrane protein
MKMMWWYGPGMNGWGHGLMTLSMVLFWALVIFAVVALVRYLGRRERVSAARPTPEQILAERFARGEINEDEYQHRLDLLTSGARPLAKP